MFLPMFLLTLAVAVADLLAGRALHELRVRVAVAAALRALTRRRGGAGLLHRGAVVGLLNQTIRASGLLRCCLPRRACTRWLAIRRSLLSGLKARGLVGSPVGLLALPAAVADLAARGAPHQLLARRGLAAAVCAPFWGVGAVVLLLHLVDGADGFLSGQQAFCDTRLAPSLSGRLLPLAARVLSRWQIDTAGCTRERAAGLSGLGHQREETDKPGLPSCQLG